MENKPIFFRHASFCVSFSYLSRLHEFQTLNSPREAPIVLGYRINSLPPPKQPCHSFPSRSKKKESPFAPTE